VVLPGTVKVRLGALWTAPRSSSLYGFGQAPGFGGPQVRLGPASLLQVSTGTIRV